MGFKMKGLSPLLKEPAGKRISRVRGVEEEATVQTGDFVDIEWLKRIYNMRKITEMLESKGYDMATLGSDPANPNRVFRRETDIESIEGSIRPTRFDT